MDEMTADKVNSMTSSVTPLRAGEGDTPHARDAEQIVAMLERELVKLRLVCECVGHEWVTVDVDGHRVCGRCGVEL